jgi:hypothetical protein
MNADKLKQFMQNEAHGQMIADTLDKHYQQVYETKREQIAFNTYDHEDVFQFTEAVKVLTSTHALNANVVERQIKAFPAQARLKVYMLLEWHYIPNRHTDRNEFEVDYFDIDRGIISVTYRPKKDGDLFDWTEAIFPVEWLKIANELTDAEWDYINGYSTYEEIEKYLNAGMEVIYVGRFEN